MSWVHRQISLPPFSRGFHLITSDVVRSLPEIESCAVGWLQVFIKHTSAALTINENADPDVRDDMEVALNKVCPEDLPFAHTCEGPDDMPAHVKSSLLGCSLLIPVFEGRLALGTWQGIYLCEHRNRAPGRTLILTLNGESRAE